ncbi:MAG: DUF2461 domain-containing protein [Oscillospiraceae bacterium]|nr:DUF2461 domain-containing protein [Oscillospiraceae bacterium]
MFQGFSQAAIDFLWGIRLNNERPWFLAHKQDYEQFVLAPMKELGAEVFDEIVKDCPKQSFRLHISRIYRDARRLFGRGPYKDHLWFVIERPHERGEGVPALYFEIAPNYYSYGCGYWDAGAATMAKLRRRIDERPEELAKIVRKLNKSRFTLGGEAFKRPKGDVGELLNPWYNRRNIVLNYDDNPEGVLFTPQLKDEIVEGFRTLLPLYRYLDTLSGDAEAEG